jgi:hypothetical protein
MRNGLRAAVIATMLVAARPAQAAIFPFSGTVTGSSVLIGADPSCAPATFRSAIDPASTVGTSSLGAFTLSTSTCLTPGGSASFCTFIISFGADGFSGSFDGGSTPTATPGISDVAWLYTILTGTGRFAGATGTLNATGTADARSRPTQVLINFDGNINAPAVPEPGTWMLMLVGFGGIGLTIHRNGRQRLPQIA